HPACASRTQAALRRPWGDNFLPVGDARLRPIARQRLRNHFEKLSSLNAAPLSLTRKTRCADVPIVSIAVAVSSSIGMVSSARVIFWTEAHSAPRTLPGPTCTASGPRAGKVSKSASAIRSLVPRGVGRFEALDLVVFPGGESVALGEFHLQADARVVPA